ncbi:hypothetical protein KC8_00620 [Sphingomonas sp. KC8]|nr:hypothetical protein KC8_00620 [Sphingomonas sp. KC8]
MCGTQKGGTTSLHAHFVEHPELSAPQKKELHFFDNESVDWIRPDYAPLHASFSTAPGHGLRYDITPIYMFWPASLERIASYNPNARLIFLFRDPLERAWSHWSMEWARKAETLPFTEAIRQGRSRLEGIPINAPAWRVFSYLERGLYGAQVERALSLFPREQLLFLRSEDLRDQHTETLDRIARFLRITRFPDTGMKTENARPAIDYPSWATAADRALVAEFVNEDLRNFAKLTGLDTDHWPCMAQIRA